MSIQLLLVLALASVSLLALSLIALFVGAALVARVASWVEWTPEQRVLPQRGARLARMPSSSPVSAL